MAENRSREFRVWWPGDEAATRELGRQLASELLPDGTLLLYGEMGAGKTVLAQGVAEGLGIERSEVRSPTFTLIHEHRGPRGEMIHIDLYRLEGEEVEALGLIEVLARPAVKVIEWPDRWPEGVPEAVRLRLSDAGGSRRRIEELGPQD